jgi:hypothetical protein
MTGRDQLKLRWHDSQPRGRHDGTLTATLHKSEDVRSTVLAMAPLNRDPTL